MSFFGDIGNFLGFGNPNRGAPPLPTAEQVSTPGVVQQDVSGYAPNMGGINSALQGLQGFANGPGVQVNQQAAQQTAAQQQQLINMLLGQASGQSGPSIQQITMGQGLDQALAQSRGLAQGMAAQNPIAALQAAGGQQNLLANQTIGQSGLLGAQQQLSAQQQANQALQGLQSANLGMSQQQLQAGLGNMQMQGSALGQLLSGQLNTASMQQQGAMAANQALVDAQNRYNQDIQRNSLNYQAQRLGQGNLVTQNFEQGQAAGDSGLRQLIGAIAGTVGAGLSGGLSKR